MTFVFGMSVPLARLKPQQWVFVLWQLWS